jgi:hypothetical protein
MREHTNEIKERLQLQPGPLDLEPSDEEEEEEVEWDGGDHDIDYDQVASDDEVDVDQGEYGSDGEQGSAQEDDEEDDQFLTEAGRDMKRLLNELSGKREEEEEEEEEEDEHGHATSGGGLNAKRKRDSQEAQSAAGALSSSSSASAVGTYATGTAALGGGKRPRIEQLDRKSYEYRLVRYIQRKGGKVGTKKLIKHYGNEMKDAQLKARFQRAVKKVSDLKQENTKKYVVLKPEYARS